MVLGKNRFEPKLIRLDYEDSLPESLAGREAGKQKGLSLDRSDDTTIQLVMAKEIVKSDEEAEKIARLVEDSLHRDFRASLEHNRSLNYRLRLSHISASISAVLSSAAGMGAGIALASEKAGDQAIFGTIGAALGAAAVGTALMVHERYRIDNYKSSRKSRLHNSHPSDFARKIIEEQKLFFDGKIFSVVPVEAPLEQPAEAENSLAPSL